jgi:hypothetical protein
MSRNGSGTYTLPAGNPVVTGTTISTTWANNTLNDLAAAMTDSVAADGQTPMTGDLDLNNNKIVNLAPAAFAGDAVEYNQLIAATTGAVSIVGGTINGTSIGATTASTGRFSTLEVTATSTFTGVSAFSAGTALLPAITTTSDTNTGIFFPAADTIAFTEGGSEVARFNSAGNLGIGTTTPNAKLNVARSDSTLIGLFSGTTKGARIGASSAYSYIEGVDNTGSASYQPFMIGGSEISFTTSNVEQMRVTSAGFLQFNSGYGSSAVAYGCRAWVNFNGTGTVAIRASGNVSSITDNGTGDYTVNFTTAMPDADYSTNVTPQATASNTGLMGCLRHSVAPTTSAVRVSVNAVDAGFRDSSYVLVSVFR